LILLIPVKIVINMENRYRYLQEQVYKRYSGILENIIYPLILLLWPLVKIAQGVDVSDSTYSLGNYLYPDNIQITWKLSTYLSNAVGAVLVRLPYGDRLIGANIYTGLVLSVIALICYYLLRNEFGALVLFSGEFAAISFCWIPTGILYNYLTYLFFTLGAVFIYYAVKRECGFYYLAAGVCLGLNVFVRIPNITEAALIIAVICGELLTKSHSAYDSDNSKLFKALGYCIIGYLVGVMIPLVPILLIYGISGLNEMITGLTGMTNTDSTYGPLEMILSTVRAYGRSLKWLMIIVAVIFAGTLMMSAVKGNKLLKRCARVVYIGVIIVMVRFFWGRGMFTFKYYEDYTSMFEWGMLTLMLAWICVVAVLISKRYNILVKTMAVIVLVMLVITPLGSNNYTCQNLNNMFLVMPFVLYIAGGWLHAGAHRFRLEGILYGCNFPWMSMMIIVIIITFVQTTLFHVNFVFRDGMDGSKRDSIVTSASVPSLAGMHTNSKNAEVITGLYEYIADNRNDIEGALYWGDCPGMEYILRLPSVITTTWPDLDSYPTDTWDTELMNLATSDNRSRTAIIWRKLDSPSGVNGAKKQDLLTDMIVTCNLETAYENEEYIVYR